MSRGTTGSADDELARARLAFISAGQQPLGAPRRAVSTGDADPRLRGAQDAAEPSLVQQPVDPARGRTFGRLHVTPRQAVAVLLLLLCGVAVALTALGRSSASQLPIEPTPVSPTATALEEPRQSPSPTPLVRVHVLGAVVAPGVVTVHGGAIVQDAVLAAGGLREDADPAELNLAAAVSDGQQVIVGTLDAPRGDVNSQPGTSASGDAGGLVNLNTATAAELEDLPGVGPVLAAAILAWREEHGRFTSTTELQEISGIGPKNYARLEPLVTT